MKSVWKATITGLSLALGLLTTGARADAAWKNVNNLDQVKFNDTHGSDYWDGLSYDNTDPTTNGGSPGVPGAGDGFGRNVGFYLTSTGFYDGADGRPSGLGLTGLEYNDLDGLNGMKFTTGTDAAATGSVTMTLEVAWNHPNNELWVLSTANGGTPAQIFAGGDTPPTTEVFGTDFAANNPYTLILVDTQNNKVYYSTGEVFEYTGADSTWYSSPDLTQVGWKTNFAVFKQSSDTNGNNLYVGIEDLRNGDDDYQDIVIKISSDGGGGVIPTPAPPAAILALVGILPCLALRRRLLGKTA